MRMTLRSCESWFRSKSLGYEGEGKEPVLILNGAGKIVKTTRRIHGSLIWPSWWLWWIGLFVDVRQVHNIVRIIRGSSLKEHTFHCLGTKVGRKGETEIQQSVKNLKLLPVRSVRSRCLRVADYPRCRMELIAYFVSPMTSTLNCPRVEILVHS